MIERALRYRASGRTSIRFLPAVAAAAAVAIGLGWVYQALTGWGYVALVLVVYGVFVIGVGAAVIAACRLGKNRNRTLGALAGLAIAACGLATSYYFDYRGTVDDVVAAARRQGADEAEVRREVEARLTFGAYVDLRVEAGWTLGKRSPGEEGTLTGAWVWIAWGLEAIGVLGIGAMVGAAFGPFCERCQTWMENETLFTRDGLDATTVDAIAAATTIDGVLQLPHATAAPRGAFALTYQVHRCKTCASDGYLTVVKRWAAPGRRGSEKKTATLHTQVAVPAERLRALQPGAQKL